MIILSLNRVVGLMLKVSLNVMTAVINKTNNEILWIIFELSFLKTPMISKNIIDNEIKISGNINSKETELLGNHKGNILSEKISIPAGSKTRGNIKCEELVVEHDANLTGKINTSKMYSIFFPEEM